MTSATPELTDDWILLGFDYGLRRIGVAVGQQVTGTAQPLTLVTARTGRPDWRAIAELVEQWQPDGFVVGMPTRLDGSEHPLATAVTRFARQLQGRFNRPFWLADERLSSYLAETNPRSRGGIDAAAAAVILESWLREQKSAGGGVRATQNRG